MSGFDFDDGVWENGEFFAKKAGKRRQMTKDDHIYGIFNTETPQSPPRSSKTLKPLVFTKSKTLEEEDMEEQEELPNKEEINAKQESEVPDRVPQRESFSQPSFTPTEKPSFHSLPQGFGKQRRSATNTKTEKQKKSFSTIKPEWEDSGSKGSAILFKIGYRGGGLGKDGKGITKPIGTRLRPQGLGLGYNNFKEQTKDTVIDFDGSLNEKIGDTDTTFPEEEETQRSWSKRSAVKKSKKKAKKKTIYQTATEITRENKKKDTIIDMRDGVAKIYDPTATSIAPVDPRSKYCTELQYNTRLLVDLVNAEVQSTAGKIKWKEEALFTLQSQQTKAERRASRLEAKIERSEKVFKLLNRANEKLAKNSFSLESLMVLFTMLRTKFPVEYEELSIDEMKVPMILPVFQRYIRACNPIAESKKLRESLIQWRALFCDSENAFISKSSQATYYLLIDDVLLPRIRSVLAGGFEVADSEKIVHSLLLWKPFFSASSFQSLMEQTIIPRLTSYLNKWQAHKEPKTQEVLLPWFSAFGKELDLLKTTMRQKFSKLLKKVNIFAEDTHTMMALWFVVLNGFHFDHLLKHVILPTIRNEFSSFVINPVNQKLEQFQGLISWRDIIPVDSLLPFFEEFFFPQFLKALELWLSNDPNYLEIQQWYMGWKKMFPKMLQEEPRIIYNFHEALLLIRSHLQSQTQK